MIPASLCRPSCNVEACGLAIKLPFPAMHSADSSFNTGMWAFHRGRVWACVFLPSFCRGPGGSDVELYKKVEEPLEFFTLTSDEHLQGIAAVRDLLLRASGQKKTNAREKN